MVLDSVPTRIFLLDRDSNYIYANKLFSDTCGRNPDDFYRGTEEYPVLDKKRRSKALLSDKEKRIIEAAHNEPFLGTRLRRYHVKEHSRRNLSHNKIHRYLLAVELARPNLQKQKKRTGISRFERHLCVRGLNHIPSKRDTLQTNGKIEEWYDNRIHGALDLEWGVTPNDAFIRKLRSESILGMFLEWNKKEVRL
jgi:PAS domain-containing protein